MTVFEMIILIAAAIAIMTLAIKSARLSAEAERVIYRGKRDLNIGGLMLKGVVAMSCCIALLATAIVIAGNLIGCSTAPKPNLIPLQAEPVKAEKTIIQTWTDFFESRD